MFDTVEMDVHWRVRPSDGFSAGTGIWIVLVL